jgi:hypothetical protein
VGEEVGLGWEDADLKGTHGRRLDELAVSFMSYGVRKSVIPQENKSNVIVYSQSASRFVIASQK